MFDRLREIDLDTQSIINTGFRIETSDAKVVPSVDDPMLTFDNFDTNSKKVKTINTCVLSIDMRGSSRLNRKYTQEFLAKLYSSYIRGVISCADHFGGRVRSIVGDGVMIVFDPVDCFSNSVHTATLLNTFVKYILNRHFKSCHISCGIGIAYGTMLVTKVGSIKKGKENAEYKDIVWVGEPANVASKLAGLGSKTAFIPTVRISQVHPLTRNLVWNEVDIDSFFESIENTYTQPVIARFKPPFGNIFSFFKTIAFQSYSPILATNLVYAEYARLYPEANSIKMRWWKKIRAKEITSEDIFMSDLIYQLPIE